MQKQRYCYLLRVQYLGFRYSGWQKQPKQKTIEGMLAKTLKFVLADRSFKILGAGRTDAKVSAVNMAFELFVDDMGLGNLNEFLSFFNENLPPDIRVLSIKEVDKAFNIIQDAKQKEYIYLFSHGEKNHPFCAPFLANILQPLDIDVMIKAAKLFEGSHDFKTYTARLQEGTTTFRTIISCELKPNEVLKANFFPRESYALHVKGEGFMRYQIRMIMGALIQLGKGELSMADIQDSLRPETTMKLTYVAPGSGLLLHELHFTDQKI
ncbi:tRNA pseudouridine(38-40) synthase TruA [Zobellia sp. OII3]|uniref:tRNA pseudouridine(38-40) synthase TruA n=1 Tax=Zobellia sp. OII3 TaxID=2034520 RepID=UPI000B530434|nr:tRNA pseudouridine(38-40) synthase TruA [Zobellia sp. OII3]OWW25647.1 tRNA pseudouridine(38-40) synthase TruA [Zobellia sp. OII3]